MAAEALSSSIHGVGQRHSLTLAQGARWASSGPLTYHQAIAGTHATVQTPTPHLSLFPLKHCSIQCQELPQAGAWGLKWEAKHQLWRGLQNPC